MWGCVLPPASGCFTPNQSEANTSQGKAYDSYKYNFSLLLIFFEYQYIALYNKGKGCGFYEKWEEISLNVFKHFCLILTFFGPPKKG